MRPVKKRKAWPPEADKLYAIQTRSLGTFGPFDSPVGAVAWADKHVVGDWHLLIIQRPPYA